MLVLQCSVHGKKMSNFVVSIDEDASVAELMEMILRDHQYSMPCSAAELTLSSEAQNAGDKSGDNNVEMERTKALKDYFLPRPSFQQDELYRVLITLPAALAPSAADVPAPAIKKRKATELDGSFPDAYTESASESEPASEPEAAEIPITLLCVAFGVFEDNCRHGGVIHLTKKDCELVFFLCRTLVEDFSSDEELETRLKDLFGDYFLADDSVSVTQQSPRARALLPFELKVHNARASSNNDVYLKNLPSKVGDSVPLPYLLLEISGPFLRVYGVVHTSKKLFCEPLVSSVPLIWLDKLNLMEFAARTCAALKIAVQELRAAQSEAPPSSSPQVEFPYRSTAVIYGERIAIQYEERLQGLVFIASAAKLDGCDVIVKFAKLRYGREVHEHCAAKGLAPELLAHEELPGGWHFCVMERVESAVPIWQVERSIVEPKLREILRVLHAANFVHGDLRIYNILWDADSQQPKLVDFDWAGVQGRTKYPPFLSPEVAWPKGVETNEVIAFAHDAVWIDEFLGT